MMVALVAGGLLMASMVALSSTVQRTFGYSKDIAELQGNLRFAMKILTDDIGRAALMGSANPGNDCRLADPVAGMPAVAFDGQTLDLRGNYVSARDYRWKPFEERIFCRNDVDPLDTDLNDGIEASVRTGLDGAEAAALDPACGNYERYLKPYADGPDHLDAFCPNQMVRLEYTSGRYIYRPVTSVGAGFGLSLGVNLNRNVVMGESRWINPVTLVRYRFLEDPVYLPLVATPTPAARRWVLQRQAEVCNTGVLVFDQPVDVADFLLPFDPAGTSGLELEAIHDANAAMCAPQLMAANLSAPTRVVAAGSIDPVQLRAFRVTLRGRTVTEDPRFVLPGLSVDADLWMNYGVDLDHSVDNGAAYVRTERTLINLRNLPLVVRP
jgi:hypothetical protein